MNSLERVMQRFSPSTGGGETFSSSSAVFPMVGQASAHLNGITMREELASGQSLAESRISCLERFDYDALYISADTWVLAEAMGVSVIQPEDAPAYGTGVLVESENDLNKLKPVNPNVDGRLPLLVEAASIASKGSRERYAVIGNYDQSPFSLACALRGVNNLMIDVLDNPSFVEKLLDICTESVIAYALALAEAGCHILNSGDSPAILLGPDSYRRYALPYERFVFDEIHNVGKQAVLHICGDANSIVADMADSGADGVELDYQVDLSLAREKLSADMVIIGNIDPVSIMLQGNGGTVARGVLAFREEMHNIEPFILSTGCVIPPETPSENIEAFMRAGRALYG